MRERIHKQMLELKCHAQGSGVSAVNVNVALANSGSCELQYRVAGEIAGLQIPDRQKPVRQDGLWRHTCFELFVARPDGRYCEFNFSPSTQWAAYQFESYRQGMANLSLPAAPVIGSNVTNNALVLDVAINLQGLLRQATLAQLRIALAVVIESRDGTLTYWALAHPAHKADFHHPDGFISALLDNGD